MRMYQLGDPSKETSTAGTSSKSWVSGLGQTVKGKGCWRGDRKLKNKTSRKKSPFKKRL